MHTVERFLIHFASSAFLVLAVYFILRFWLRRNAKVGNWISSRRSHMLVLSALLVFALSTLREPFDVIGAQSAVKSVFDYVSWFLGVAVAAWGLHRYHGSED